MKNAILRLLLATIVGMPSLALCQSFIFCPDIETPEKKGFDGVKVSIVFDDSRTYDKKRKEKCTKTEIFGEFANCIKRTYPNMQLTILDEKMFYEDPAKGSITIKVKFRQYDATFYTGRYVASTKYEVKIFDNRKEERVAEQTITGDGKQMNTLGSKSGKIASNRSFKEAFDKFILMIDSINIK